MLLALLNPSFGDLKGSVKARGKDVFLLIDISKSMDATDIQPSRIEKAKFEINRLANNFANDRVGLIVFSQDALMLSPLTFDRNAISLFIPKINTNLLPEGGTDFSPALQMAFDKLTKTKSKTQAKVIILISDGENFGSDSKSILAQIRKKGIIFFTIGVGTSNGITLRQGSNFKKDDNGDIVVTKLESAYLQKMASLTGGKYLEINTVSGSFNELIAQLEQIKANFTDELQVDVIANKYFYFLIIALFLLGIDVFFTVSTFQL
jgi:Ca-activated chloride channel family protein